MSPEEAATLAWVRDFVVRLNLCPFAAAPLRQNRVVCNTCRDTEPEAAFHWAGTQVQGQLNKPADQVETTLLLFPDVLAEFDDFMGFVGAIEQLLEDSGADGFVQLAHFHPEYQFAGERENDAANATNRSPYPTVQLLRVSSVAEATRVYPDIASIPERNVALLRKLSASTDE
ncbi:hypothetical protein GGR28_000872 [Lewinella aquimaris]|uniref:DUF1415 domain-containing protein n=1 Tax=Neolewinella aquimaris TaxID=1835722 RepID=A0A840DZ55_9BACT|nr:DUF1415 domain-containing protein [Neolewinella aquimaris]MBB4078271.1 hypothetical protein [Neolewinella aquimaris]